MNEKTPKYKLSLTVGPTFQDPDTNIYYKASASIEFNSDELSEDGAKIILAKNYEELLRFEKKAMKNIRDKKKLDAVKWMIVSLTSSDSLPPEQRK